MSETTSRPVIAAIPNYNNAHHLEGLVPGLLEQNYDEVIVLDDASSDHSRDVVVNQGALWVSHDNDQQLGSAANRNRIIGAVEDRFKSLGDAIIHFIDSDMGLRSAFNPEIAQHVFDNRSVGMAGGLIREPGGHQMPYNYGPDFTAKSVAGSVLQNHVATVAKTHPEKAAKIRERSKSLLAGWPDTTKPLEGRQVHWVAEGNMLIPARVFRAIGGFPDIPHHEIQGIGIELKRLGLTAQYEPLIEMNHLEGGAPERQLGNEVAAIRWLIKRYGLIRYMTGHDTARV